MKLPTFKEWLSLRLEADAPAAPAAPDPAILSAQAAVKAKLQNPDTDQPLAAQARTALGQAAAASPNPMQVAKLDKPEDAPAAGPTQKMQKKMGKK